MAKDKVEEVQREGNRRKRSMTKCGLCADCPEIKGSYKRHLQHHHLPWYFHPVVACWEHKINMGQLGNLITNHREKDNCWEGKFRDAQLSQWVGFISGVLFYLASVFGLNHPAQLIELVQKNGWHSSKAFGMEVSLGTVQLWKELEKWFGGNPTVFYRLDPPETIAALTHFSIMRFLLGNAGKKAAGVVRSMETFVNPQGEKSKRIPAILKSDCELADSHCHLVTTMAVHKCWALNELKNKHEWLMEGAGEVPVIICNVVHKNCWRSWADYQQIQGVYFTFGIHPLLAGERGLLEEDQLTVMSEDEYCRGIGECGFDTSRCSTDDRADVVDKQEQVFRMQLRVAGRRKLPVVIHVRGRDAQEQAWLSTKAMGVMREMLDRTHRVHVHCFTGTIATYHEWQRTFPRAMFGFTSKIEELEVRKVARMMRLQQILLESDAPYLVPEDKRHGHVRNSPFFVESILTGLRAAFILPRSVLGPITVNNCCEMYGLDSRM